MLKDRLEIFNLQRQKQKITRAGILFTLALLLSLEYETQVQRSALEKLPPICLSGSNLLNPNVIWLRYLLDVFKLQTVEKLDFAAFLFVILNGARNVIFCIRKIKAYFS